MRLTCATGVFEFHAADADHLLVAIDNLILTLDRSPGAFATPSSAAGAVQAFLERHFLGSRAFQRDTIRNLGPVLSTTLAQRIDRYFDIPPSPDEAPVIDGDPFTDSQEYPTRFSVRTSRVTGAKADVTVRFADGWTSKVLRYQLHRDASGWRLDDIVYPDAGTFRQVLSMGITMSPIGQSTPPVWAKGTWEAEARRLALTRDSSLSPAAFIADFDGDDRDDIAWLVRHRSTGARGILIARADGRRSQLCGAGITCGNGGDDFSWMDTWRLSPRETAAGFSLIVERSESGGGRIEFSRGRFRWFQRGD